MARRGENIRKRKDGRWEGRYKKDTKYVSVYGRTYSEVKEKLLNAKLNVNKPDKYICEDRKFYEIIRLWVNSNRIRIKGATEYKYTYIIEKHIIPALGEYRVSEINSAVINIFLDEKLRAGRIDGDGGLSSSYVKTMAIIINSVIHYAEAEGICKPLNTPILKPQTIKKEMQILTYEAQNKLEEMMSVEPDATKLGAFIALNTGMRIGEICALSWNEVDINEKVIHVRHTISRIINNDSDDSKTKLIVDKPKTKAAIRDIPISSVLLPILSLMKKDYSSEYVLTGTNNFVSTRTYDYRYRNMLSSLGIMHINFHALRHTFATRCIEAGVDVKSLSEILGHANVSTTLSTYVHPSMELKRIQIEKLYEKNIAV